MLQRPKKLRMSVLSFQDQETKSSNWDSHVIQSMFSSCRCGKMPAAGFRLLDSMSLGQGTLRREKGNLQDGLRLSGHLVNLVSPFRMGLWYFAHHNVHVLLACFFSFSRSFAGSAKGLTLVLKRFALLLRSPYFHCFKLNHLTSQVAPTFWFCPCILICSSTFTCLL